ncbi:hypothetical protein BIWAKO_05171 [Bosea sp. BIWAKO-01]|nr:hypothetical protein BIWAKO_05171 [Bosea sp. BIWAKO-01]
MVRRPCVADTTGRRVRVWRPVHGSDDRRNGQLSAQTVRDGPCGPLIGAAGHGCRAMIVVSVDTLRIEFQLTHRQLRLLFWKGRCC